MRIAIAAFALGLTLTAVALTWGQIDDRQTTLRVAPSTVDPYAARHGERVAPTVSEQGAPAADQPMPVVGPDGKLIVCPQDGQQLEVTLDGAAAAPQVGTEVRDEERSDSTGTSSRVTVPVVPRCGSGGGDDPVWIPEDAAKGVTAPARFR